MIPRCGCDMANKAGGLRAKVRENEVGGLGMNVASNEAGGLGMDGGKNVLLWTLSYGGLGNG